MEKTSLQSGFHPAFAAYTWQKLCNWLLTGVGFLRILKTLTSVWYNTLILAWSPVMIYFGSSSDAEIVGQSVFVSNNLVRIKSVLYHFISSQPQKKNW